MLVNCRCPVHLGTWAARYNTWLLIKLTLKGVVFCFLFYIWVVIPDLTGMWSAAPAAWQTLVLQIGTGVVEDIFSVIVLGTQLQLWRHDCNFGDTTGLGKNFGDTTGTLGTQLQVREMP